MSAHTDDNGVSAASFFLSVVIILNGNEHSELIEGGIEVPVPC